MTADPESPEARPPHRTVRLNDYRLNDSTGQNSEVSFFALLDMLPAAAYTCDADGLITYFNQHAIQIWGRAPKLNDPVDRYCGSFKLYSSEGSPITHDTCWMALALKTGDEYQGREITIERADGSRVAVLAHASPIRDESGQIVGAVNVLTDVSDRRRHEEVQALLASIVESSDDAIISKTLEGRILSWNAAAERLFGYPAYEAVGAPITLIIPRDRRHEEASILAKLRRGERIEHYDTLRVTKYGRPVEISLTISPIRDSAGRIVAASKIARDITARKRSERFVEEQTHVLKMIAQREPLPAILTLLCKITEEQTAGEARASILLVDADGLHLPIGAASSLPEQFNGATEGIAIGAEADAMWLLDAEGFEVAHFGFNAVLRDYARLGRLLAHDGAWQGKQIIRAQWMIDATTVRPSDAYLLPGRAMAPQPFGYGYLLWLLPGQRRQFAIDVR
jgi:PAS domain S-box-containing protein